MYDVPETRLGAAPLGGPFIEPREQRVERAPDAARQQLLLAANVIIDAGLGDTRRPGDVVERAAVVPALAKHAHRHVENRVEGVRLALLRRWTAHRYRLQWPVSLTGCASACQSLCNSRATAPGESAVKYAIAIRNMGPQSNRTTIRSCARIAEQAGFDALFVSDHLCIPPDQTEGSGGRYLDVLATLAFIAGATEKIRLGVSVLVVPYRPAVLTAKQVATIQELSGERMILGVGGMKPEFAALGANIRKRGAITDETLSVLHHLFSADVPGAYDGPLVKFPSFVFLPRPKRPPIWIGGNGPAATNRVLKYGDGWHPMLPAAELKAKVEELNARARSAGRELPEIVVRRGLKLDDTDAARAKVAAEKDAGATYFILDLGRYADEHAFGKAAETFMARVAS